MWRLYAGTGQALRPPHAERHATGHPSVERFFQLSLLGLVASGYLAVAGSGYLDAPTVVLVAAAVLVRGLVICGLLRLDLTDRAATRATLGYAAFFPADYFLLSRDFLAATVHLVFFLAVMKILTSKNHRDYLALAAISFLELVAAAMLSINFNFFVFLALYLMFGIAALTSGEIRRSIGKAAASTARGGLKRFHPRLALLAVCVTLGILALTAGMFFLLPRTADAALAGLVSHRIFIPGLSNHVTLGEIGELKTSSQPVMHIAIYSNPTGGALKWRGGAMTEFDGRMWSDPDRKVTNLPVENGRVVLRPEARPPGARSISYGVKLASLDSPALFFAGIPESVEGLPDRFLKETESGSFRLWHNPPPGFRYEAYSLLESPPESAQPLNPPPVLGLARRVQCLQLPPRLDPRIPRLAQETAAGASTPLARARAIETHLRTAYGYTLQLPQHEVADPLAYFLFTRKKGHCEYFASAMAVMLRSLGIPARLATGFLNGVYNPMSDLWLVRASDAHSWVEAWMPGLGWTTFDPTPPDPNQHGASWLAQFGLYLDAAETFWQSWVVGYDPGRQGTLADRVLGIHWYSFYATALDWDQYARRWLRRFGAALGLTVAVGLGCWLVGPRLVRLVRIRRRVQRARRGYASVADATLLYQRMLHVLKRHGYQKPAWFTPAEFARSLAGTHLGRPVEDFTTAYNALRFGGRTEAAPRLSILLDELERQRC